MVQSSVVLQITAVQRQWFHAAVWNYKKNVLQSTVAILSPTSSMTMKNVLI